MEHNHDIVCEQNECKQGMNPGKIHAEPPTKNLLPTSGAGRPRDTACDVTVKPSQYCEYNKISFISNMLGQLGA